MNNLLGASTFSINLKYYHKTGIAKELTPTGS